MVTQLFLLHFRTRQYTAPNPESSSSVIPGSGVTASGWWEEELSGSSPASGAANNKPAMPELGTTPCPVCHRRVTVFVTKSKRPFINCGFCGARIFYNGSAAIRRLKRQMKKIKGLTTERKVLLTRYVVALPATRAKLRAPKASLCTHAQCRKKSSFCLSSAEP